MQEYKAKISENGRILIPAIIRNQLHLEVGDELVMRVKNDELHLISFKSAIKKAQTLVNKYISPNQSLVADLKAARQAEAENE
ncbi:hypothetical protein BH10PSE19_BH10PSE19_14720 [soil metagenome]